MVEQTRRHNVEARWNKSVASVPSIFSRLLALSALRDANTGRYIHYGLALAIGDDATHELLNNSHQQIFDQWQTLTLPAQLVDLKGHLRGVAQETDAFGEVFTSRSSRLAHILTTWVQTQPYRNFVPLSASSLSRDAFLINMTSLVALLRNRFSEEAGVSGQHVPE
ncbi:MAG: hypothetical protein QOJ99_836 [Bryobacterales bacterium]|jgi:hypothetical protein|nr:hypothetical protein [Bryobacterales bacterium]